MNCLFSIYSEDVSDNLKLLEKILEVAIQIKDIVETVSDFPHIP